MKSASSLINHLLYKRAPTVYHTAAARRAFGYYSQPVLKMQQVDMDFQTASSKKKLTIPFEARSLQVQVDLEGGTLASVGEQLMKQSENVQEVTFYTIDGAKIPQNELLKERNNIPFIMTVLSKNGQVSQNYAINLNEGFAIGSEGGYKSKTSEEAYLEYCLGIGLPKYSSFLLANLASKLHKSLPQKQHNVSNDSIL